MCVLFCVLLNLPTSTECICMRAHTENTYCSTCIKLIEYLNRLSIEPTSNRNQLNTCVAYLMYPLLIHLRCYKIGVDINLTKNIETSHLKSVARIIFYSNSTTELLNFCNNLILIIIIFYLLIARLLNCFKISKM